MRKIQLDEQAVVAMYEQVETTGKVAAEFNVSNETIRRILKRNGIKRTYRHPKPEPKVKKSHCRSKYCPALIVMLHNAFGWNAKQIAEATGYAENGTRNILSRRGLVAAKRSVSNGDFDLDQIEREYLDGVSSYKLGEKYGVNPQTISKWMRQRGIRLGKGAHQEGRKGNDKFVYSERMKEINQRKHENGERRFIRRLAETQGGRFEYVGGFRDGGRLVATVRCTACGHEFVHSLSEMDKRIWQCPSCTEMTLARKSVIESVRRIVSARERTSSSVDVAIRRMDEAKESLRIYMTDRKCVVCGSVFHDVNPRHICCCDECSKRYARKQGHGDFHRHRARKYNVAYDGTITLRGVFTRDNGICQLCGEPCDWDDREYGVCGPTYPSIDHIVPFAQGGEHTWDNVQLAHFICNSRKRDLPDDVAREAVTLHVKVAC